MPMAKASMPPSVVSEVGVGATGSGNCRIDFLQEPSSSVADSRVRAASFRMFGLYSCFFILFDGLIDQLEPYAQRDLIGPEVRRAIKIGARESSNLGGGQVVALFVVCTGILRVKTAVFGKGQQVAAGCGDGEAFDRLGAGNEPGQVVAERQVAQADIGTIFNKGRDG